jgi:hypothetical protein
MGDGDGVDAPATGMDRRDFLRSSVVVGGLVWAAPAMSSLGSHAYAAGTPLNICATGEMPSGLRWQYTGRGCGNAAPPALDFCEDRAGYPDEPSSGIVKVTITGGPDRGIYTTGDPGRNETGFELDGGGLLEPGATFSAPPNGGKAGAQTLFEVYRQDGTLVHRVQVHTSCSRELSIGEQFGSFRLIAGLPAG